MTGRAKPRVFPPFAILSAPQIDKPVNRKTREPSSPFKVVVLCIHTGLTHVQVTQEHSLLVGYFPSPSSNGVPIAREYRS